MNLAAPRTRSADLRTGCLLAAALAAVAAAFAAGGEPRSRVGALAAPPLAWADARCTALASDAEAKADAAAASAEAHMARYPFAPAEGLRALALLAEARECLALARSGSAASAGSALARRAAVYRARLEAD